MKRKSMIIKALLLGSAAAAFGASGAAWSQEAQGSEVDTVVVTAQRRAERLEDVPMTVTALPPEVIEERGIRNLQDLSQGLAGVQINFGGAFTQPSIRGISTLTTGVGFENNVALYIDGFYQDDTSSINADFANLANIQVLKGPQGTLYGRNATGGAFLMTTLKPSDTFTGKIDGKYGSFNDRSISGYVSGPINESTRFSIAGYARDTDGYYDLLDAAGKEIGDAAPMHSYSVRTKLEGDVTDWLTATLAYNFTELDDPRGLLFTVESHRSPALPAQVGRLYQRRTFATNHDSRQFNIVHEGTLTLAIKTPIGTLMSYTGRAHRPIKTVFDFDGSWADYSFSNVRYASDSFQQGLDYSIDVIDNLDLIVGATYWDNDVQTRFSDTYSADTLRSRTISRAKTTAWAVFADGSYTIADKLVVNVGARYTVEERTAFNKAIIYPSGAFAAPPIDGTSVDFENFSPRVSVRYEIADNTNVYASYSKGFRSGFVQVVPTLGTNLIVGVRPEKITAYEVGFKTAQPGLQFSTAAYYYDYRDIQVGITIPNPLAPTAPINLVSNAPKAEVYGVEAQATWEPIDHLDINLAVAWTHARYVEFANATGNGLRATTNLNISGQPQDWSGQEMARAPEFTAALGVDYEWVNVMGGSLMATTNLKYTDSYVPNNPSLFGPLATPGTENQQRYRQDGYTLLNASLTWTDPTEHYKFGVWANNLTDVDYHLSMNGGAFGDYGAWASPRTYGIRIGYSF